jgi:hypothetical protein
MSVTRASAAKRFPVCASFSCLTPSLAAMTTHTAETPAEPATTNSVAALTRTSAWWIYSTRPGQDITGQEPMAISAETNRQEGALAAALDRGFYVGRAYFPVARRQKAASSLLDDSKARRGARSTLPGNSGDDAQFVGAWG